MPFKKRSDLHLARKIWHVTTVSLMCVVYIFAPQWLSMTLLFSALIAGLLIDFLRQTRPHLNQSVQKVFGPLMRENELNGLAGTTYLLIGVSLLVIFFEPPLVVLTLLFLAFADPIASYVGIKYGKDRIFAAKSLQGFLAAFLVCTLLAYLFLSFYGIEQRRLVASLIAGLIGALAELIPIAKLDDNLTLPLLSALGLSGLFYLFAFDFS